jgi:hypothetical protein
MHFPRFSLSPVVDPNYSRIVNKALRERERERERAVAWHVVLVGGIRKPSLVAMSRTFCRVSMAKIGKGIVGRPA